MNIALISSGQAIYSLVKPVLENYSYEHQLLLEIRQYPDKDSFCAAFRPYLFSLILLDFTQNGKTCIETARFIRRSDTHVPILFFRQGENGSASSFSLQTFESLFEPFSPEELPPVLDQVFSFQSSSEPKLLLKNGKKNLLLPYSQIVAIRSDDHYIDVSDPKDVLHRGRMKFSEVLKILSPDPRFLQILRGLLVNMDHVTRMENVVCFLDNGQRYPMNVRKSRSLEQTWQNYVLSKKRDSSLLPSDLS